MEEDIIETLEEEGKGISLTMMNQLDLQVDPTIRTKEFPYRVELFLKTRILMISMHSMSIPKSNFRKEKRNSIQLKSSRSFTRNKFNRHRTA